MSNNVATQVERDADVNANGVRPDLESFYHLSNFRLGGHACQGTACFLARHLAPDLWEHALTEPRPIYCLGRCFAAPATASIGERPHIEACSKGIVTERLVSGGARLLKNYGPYLALHQAMKQSPYEVIHEIEASGLRGRGGAGFPTARKWLAVRQVNSTMKYVIANGDEGDPGAYIDRFLMEDDPHALIEGLIIAAYCVGASQGWIYVRAEYPTAARELALALDEARTVGYLGHCINGTEFSFDIRIHVGCGSYVCGEETALINSLEGKRPMVRSRPPYPTEHGLFGQPTLVNNVETLVNIPWIIRNGGDAFHALGFSQSRGTKVVSLNSLFRRPGLYEVEFGISTREIIEGIGGGLKSGNLKGVIIGGPLAGIIPPHLLDTPFGFEELHAIGASVGHGGILAFDEHTSIPELVHHVAAFAAYESCGKCTPCRIGTKQIAQMFASAEGRIGTIDREAFSEITSVLCLTSLCGHGLGFGEFLRSAVRHYGKELSPCFA